MSWLKFDTSTPEKPEVLAITIELGWDDPDLTVGKLLKVWRWFDEHSTNGNAPSVTLPLLDRIIGVTGITQAMINVGWVESLDGGGLAICNFENHNGATAKDRALAAKRAASHRWKLNSNVESNVNTVTNALPREEKRREEKNIVSKDTKALTRPDDVSKEVWDDFKKQRKVALTATALKGIVSEAAKAEITLEAALVMACNRGWKSFKADWIKDAGVRAIENKQTALEARNKAAREEWFKGAI